MKLQCPHCGVKGSAEDSYSGRKVKCPKCQGLFELKPEMALKLPEDSTLVSELSSAPSESPAPLGEVDKPVIADNDFGEAGVDETLAVEEFERSVELNGEPTEPELEPTPHLKEEALDWEDVASEIDLQLAEGESGEEADETLQGTPEDSSSLEDEFATPVDDLGLTVEEESAIGDATGEDVWDEVEENPAKTEVTEFMEESSLLDSVDSPGLERERDNDLEEPAAIVENSDEGDSVAVEEFERSVELNEEPAEPELEPTPLLKEEKEEMTDWEDVAAKLDLQLAEGELAGESDETLQGIPGESSSLEDEFATPADDLGLTVEEESTIGDATDEDIWDEVEENPAETEVTEHKEESSLHDPVDSPSLEQEIENDLEEPAPIGEPEEVVGTNLNQDKGEILDAEELSAAGSGLNDDAINESDNKPYRGNAISKAWSKIKAIWR